MKNVLDACCGSKMFWFDKDNPLTLFHDKRVLNDTLCDGRSLVVDPDVIGDFTSLDFHDESFNLVVFDPPHMTSLGEKSWMAKKYGRLCDDWMEVLILGFNECFRVLKNDGVLVFKWNETDILTSQVLLCSPYKPMFGHTSGKRSGTHWICFMKNPAML